MWLGVLHAIKKPSSLGSVLQSTSCLRWLPHKWSPALSHCVAPRYSVIPQPLRTFSDFNQKKPESHKSTTDNKPDVNIEGGSQSNAPGEHKLSRWIKARTSKERFMDYVIVYVAVICSLITLGYHNYDSKYAKVRGLLARAESMKLARVGGEFTLVDHNGSPVTNVDLEGKFILAYFGFTYCPDICPVEMARITRWIQQAEQNPLLADMVRAVFVTIDPARDTVGQLRSYLYDFHPSIMGLTGTPAQIQAACKAYHVYINISPGQDNDDYLLDHSRVIYLISPEGKFMDYYQSDAKDEEVLERLQVYVQHYLAS